MLSSSRLTVGHIPYLNCVPWFHFLQDTDFSGELVSGVPSSLNSHLQQGALDISPSSSFEYARNWQDYLLLPEHSISSVGKVKSVLLFSPVELAELAGREIAITGESATSINLLRIILREFCNLTDVSDRVPDVPVENLIEQRKPALLIGDRALQLANNCPVGIKIFDLGEIWYQQTGLPFVFALWILRRKAVARCEKQLVALSDQLQQAYALLMDNPAPIAELQSAMTGLSVTQIVDYWQSIDYRLDEEHLDGLTLFFKLCVKHNLLPEEPPLEFFQNPVQTVKICS